MSEPAAWSIRRAVEGDAGAVLAILNPIIEARVYSALDSPFTLDDERAFIRGLAPRAIFHVAVDPHGIIAGFQVVEPYATYTHAFDHVGTIGTFVALDRRRQGIATALFRATFSAALAAGFEKLFAFVRADNPAALETYRRQGFERIGTARRHARIDGRYIDEILIERALGG